MAKLAFLKYKKGYTLVELLVTIAVIGILLAISAPTLRADNARRSLSGAAKLLKENINQTRAKAIAIEQEIPSDQFLNSSGAVNGYYQFNFNLNGGTYQIGRYQFGMVGGVTSKDVSDYRMPSDVVLRNICINNAEADDNCLNQNPPKVWLRIGMVYGGLELYQSNGFDPDDATLENPPALMGLNPGDKVILILRHNRLGDRTENITINYDTGVIE